MHHQTHHTLPRTRPFTHACIVAHTTPSCMRNTYSYTLHSFTHIFTNTHTRVVHRTIEHSLPSANEINPLRLINYNVYYVHWPKASNMRSFTYFLDRSSAIHPCAQITRSSETLTQWSKYQKSKYQNPFHYNSPLLTWSFPQDLIILIQLREEKQCTQ